MISIPIWVFVLMSIPVAFIVLDVVLSIIDSIKESRIRKQRCKIKLEKSIQIMRDANENPEYIPKEERNGFDK